ncbi:MAG: ADP-glyceromanno-heptose 6-epimerase [Spartobacteria bacterium]|nr:ADP-glyceromanno-heptose 6-epimerase [Spartobacteria bacterium]
MRINVIVTGGAGFIGRNMVEALNLRGEEDILIVDKLGTDNKWKNLVGLRFEDIIEPNELMMCIEDGQPFEGLTTVIHMGACSATTEKDADFLLNNNYQYTRMLCEWCLENDIRFIYASSAATYGNGDQGYSDDDAVMPSLKPLNMYGYSKHMFDLWAMKHGYLDRIVGLKFFNVYGPGEDHKDDMRSVINKAYAQVLETGKIRLFKSHHPDYADGEQLRDFVYVKDAVAVTLYFMDHVKQSGLFNCGTGESRSWNDLANAVFAAMDRTSQIEYFDMPETLRAKYQYYTKADPAKLRQAGYTVPFTSLEDGTRDYVRNYLAMD